MLILGYYLRWKPSYNIKPGIELAFRMDEWSNADCDDYFNKKAKFNYENFTESTIKDYVDKIVEKLSFNKREQNRNCPPITYTAMHGVGYPYIVRAFNAMGFSPLATVAE